MKTVEEENAELKKAIKWLLVIIKEHEPNIDMMLYPHQQQFLNRVRSLVKVKPVKSQTITPNPALYLIL